MTFGEKRRLLRMFRLVADSLRSLINSHGLRGLPSEVTVSRPEYEALEFGLMHLKVWLPDLDEEQEVIPGSGRYVRMNSLFRKQGISRDHLLFKGIPIFYEGGV